MRSLRCVPLLMLAACSHPEPAGSTARATAHPPGTSQPVLGAPLASTVAAAIETPLAWGTRPAATGDLYPLLDGQCIHLDAWPLPAGAAVAYGNPVGNLWGRGGKTTLAKIGAGGLDLASVQIAEPDVAEVGAFGSELWAREAISTRMSSGTMNIWRIAGATWKKAIDGHALGKAGEYGPSTEVAFAFEHHGVPVFGLYDLDASKLTLLALDGSAVPAAAAKAAALPKVNAVRALGDAAYLALTSDGDAWRVGATGGAPEKLVIEPLTRPGALVSGTFYWASVGASLVRIGAAEVTRVALPAGAGDVRRLRPHGAAGVLAITAAARLFAVADATATEITGTSAVDAVSATRGTIWILDSQQRLHEHKPSGDRVLDLPEPPWAVTGRYAASELYLVDDAVLMNAKYVEKGLGWNRPEPWRALLSSKRPSEVLRCRNANDNFSSGQGFVSWPPKADAACRTPLMVWYPHNWMTTRGYEVGKGNYPTLRGLLAKVTPDGVLLDLELDGKKVLGQRMQSREEAIRAATAATKTLTLMRPELVCAEPAKILREVPITQ